RASVAVFNIPFHGDDSDAIVNQPMQLFVLIGGHRDFQFSTVVDKAWTTLIFVRGEQLLVERPTDVMQNNTRFWRTQNGRHTLLLLTLPRCLMPRRIVLHSLLIRTPGIHGVALASLYMCHFRPLRVAA